MRDRLRRAMWLFLVVLFVATGLGFGIWGFWAATRQDDTNPLDELAQNSSCPFDTVRNVETLPAPEPYKPPADVTKLETTDLQAGTGAEVKKGACVTAKYLGTIATTGAEFDGDFDQPEAIKFPLSNGAVIPGWDQGLLGMKVGGLRRLVIPAELAYGPRGVCETRNQQDPNKCDVYSIEPNTDLVFWVKVLDAK